MLSSLAAASRISKSTAPAEPSKAKRAPRRRGLKSAPQHRGSGVASGGENELETHGAGTSVTKKTTGVIVPGTSRSAQRSSAFQSGGMYGGFHGLHGLQRDNARLLPVSFFNAEGQWESGSVPALLAIHEDDSACSYAETASSTASGRVSVGGVEPLPRASACERLRRTLFETGQLLVTTEDGLSRVWFAGVGDPDVLFVEVVPRDATPAQEAEHAFPGCVCSLREAEALLSRIYEGESSARLTRLVEGIRSAMKF